MLGLPSLNLLERLPDGRPYAEFVGGELDGAGVVLQGWRVDATGSSWDACPGTPGRRRRRGPTPAQRAEQLLTSLLDERQRAGWRTNQHFWVRTSLGSFRLGTLYDIRYRPPGDANSEYSICVVPQGWEGRQRPFPLADLWVNLLLALRADPAGFLHRANVMARRDLRDGTFHQAPPTMRAALQGR